MTLLITGASGLLGKKIHEQMSKTDEVAGTYNSNSDAGDFHHLNIANKNTVDALFERMQPKRVIHTAALIDVDYAERNRELADGVNITGTRNIVDACQKYGAKLVYVSSDFVFDGKNGPYNEDSTTNPVNHYGATKLEGERIVRGTLEDYLIVRPTILSGNFITKIAEQLRDGKEIHLDNKTTKYPVLTDDVSEAIKFLLDRDLNGTYHVGGPEGITKYEWAKKVALAYGLPSSNIFSDGSPGEAPRPLDARLDSSKLTNLGFKFLGDGVEKGIRVTKNQNGCMFNLIYTMRPDMLVLDESASAFRMNLGKQLAKESPASADIVVPIPESGIFGATGFAAESKTPYVPGIIRDYVTKRTLFEPTLKMRTDSLEKKLIAVPDVVGGKNVVLVDEAIIAGTTLKVAIDKIKKAGAREIHVRIPSPAMLYNCNNGVLRPDASLIARDLGNTKEEIENNLREHLKVDSLRFLTLDGMLGALPSSLRKDACYECFKKRDGMKIVRLDDVPEEVRGKGAYSIKRLCTEPLNCTPSNIGFYETTIPPGSKVKRHIHEKLDEYLIFITPGKVTVGSEVHNFKAGDLMVLPPNTDHEIFAEDKEVKLLAIKLPNIVNDKVEL